MTREILVFQFKGHAYDATDAYQNLIPSSFNS